MEGIERLTSPLLGAVPELVHDFGRRIPGTRAEAREVTQRAFCTSGDVFFLRQVHGCQVATAPWPQPPEADGGVTGQKGVLLAIETADCLPILIVDPIHRQVAAAHAGWRGTAARVAEQAVRALVRAGSKPAQLLAALGPAIGPCCYEVGADVEAAFGPAGAAFLVPGPGGRKHLDVARANRTQLEEAGLVSTHIESVEHCTRCREDLFFSYRRDGALAGRMISVIGFSR